MIPEGLEKVIQKFKVRDFPPDYYVFGYGGTSNKPADKKHWYRRHCKCLEALGFVDKRHDFYAWKHTGVIALFKATQNIELIRNQCRHSDIATTQNYLRDLGLFFDYSEINKFPEI